MSEFLQIEGGSKIAGRVRVSGAKNSSLPLMIATLLSSSECRLENVPDLEDTSVTIRLLSSLGAKAQIEYKEDGGATVVVNAAQLNKSDAPYHLVKMMRASFWTLGPLLARTGYAKIPLPGGDAIGTRPVDIHLNGLSKFGAEYKMKHGVVEISAPHGLKPANVHLAFPSVGATHQLLMTASLIEGETLLSGVAKEPEIIEMAQFLSSMGAKIEGAGTDIIKINGRRELGSGSHKIIGDRIEAITYLSAAAITGGEVQVDGITSNELAASLEVLQLAGCNIESDANSQSIFLRAPKFGSLKPFSFKTEPFPGVATDTQPMLLAVATLAEGTSVVNETIFENRFQHVAEYRRFGADIKIDGRVATVHGVKQLSGAPCEANDIRAGAGLVLMALAAEGESEIYGVHHIDRGYDGLESKMKNLGVKIRRERDESKQEIIIGC